MSSAPLIITHMSRFSVSVTMSARVPFLGARLPLTVKACASRPSGCSAEFPCQLEISALLPKARTATAAVYATDTEVRVRHRHREPPTRGRKGRGFPSRREMHREKAFYIVADAWHVAIGKG